jgi:excisionase family DNA binding protein
MTPPMATPSLSDNANGRNPAREVSVGPNGKQSNTRAARVDPLRKKADGLPHADAVLGVLADTLAESVADRVAARLADQQPESLKAEPGKLALTKAEAADALGMSVDHFERHVMADLRIVRSGRLRLIPVAELEAWLGRSASRSLAA